ncbi:uncharacterized protein TNCV_4327041 [Trichonephila clavipes]|nr:uncharacterized protein TNCV_4327041 [Trichonephila clavipes]
MGKLPDLHAFDIPQIAGARRKGHSISEIARQLGFSRSTVSRVYKDYMDGEQQTSDRENCKEQLALIVWGKRWLNRIVRSPRSQKLAEITTRLNDGASRTVDCAVNGLCNSRFNVWVSGSVELRKYYCSMLAIELHIFHGQESTKIGVMSIDSD